MKKRLLTIHLILLLSGCFFVQPLAAQDNPDDPGGFDMSDPMLEQSVINAGLGVTTIDGQSYVGFRIQPELAIGKLGFGLDVPLLFSLDDGSIRTDEYIGGVGALRLIRYVRWGVKKRDPFYIRVGDISGSYLGYGILVNNYTNAVSFEKRKVGVTYDILVKNMVGLEGLYSDFNAQSFNLFGVRPYVRPLGNSGIPILKTLEVGFSYVTDHDDTRMKINDSTYIAGNEFVSDDGMSAWSADMGLWLINNRFIRLSAYTQYGNLLKNESELLNQTLSGMAIGLPAEDSTLVVNYDGASGFSVGMAANMNLIANVFRLDARIERLWYNDYFRPQFFDAVYEMDKDAKILSLATTEEKTGTYGSLTASVIDKIAIRGSLMMPDNVSATAPGFIEFTLDASQLVDKIHLQGSYLKGGLTAFSFSEIFDIDDRSLTSLRVGYKVKPWLILGVDYKWTYAQTEEGGFEATNHIMPYFGINFPLNIGGNNNSQGDDW